MKTSQVSKVISAISYLPFLFFLPFVILKDDEESKFHGKQSLVLFTGYVIISLILWLLSVIFKFILGNVPIIGIFFKIFGWVLHNFIGTIIGICYLVLIIICLIYTASGIQWEVPLAGKYARALKI
jgi:uncharacterized membrane protein